MAGGKETPRQKMIGMMYLVLTALLALQIKDAVLEKFILIENGLAVSNQSLLDYNQRTLLDIKEDVVNQGDKEGDQAVALTAQNIRDYTTGLVAYIDDMKYQVGSASSGGDTSKVYERSTLKKYEEPSRYLYEQHFGDSLKAQLDAFPQQVNAAIDKLGKGGMNPEWMQSIAIDANDMKLYEDNQEEKNKSYSKFNFYKAPLASVLAQLTFYKNQVYAKESEALNKLKTLVGSAVTVKPADIEKLGSFDAVAPTPRAERPQVSNDNAAKNPQATPRASNNSTQTTEIKPEDFLQGRFAGIDYAQATILSESNLVTAGLDFNAQAFLTLGNSSLQPTVKRNGEDVDVVNGRGIINFRATAANNEYDENGIATKSFEVEIIADDGTGNQITRTTTHEYSIARPVIDVRSQSVEVLYLNCQNVLNINVPALGPAYQPSFTVDGGTYVNGSQKGQILVDPTQTNVRIGVSSGGQYIDFRDFEAKSVPLPVLTVRPDRQAYDPTAGFDGKPNELAFRLTPDADFADRFENDRTFLVSKGTVTLLSGRNQKARINIDRPMSNVNLSQLSNRIQSGDRIVVSIEEIVRINFKDEEIRIPFFGGETISIN